MIAPTADGRGTLIDVKVVPGASRSEIAGEHGGVLRVRVAAPPERGRANDAVCELLAGRLGVPRRDVSVVRGGTSRVKTIRVDGLAPREVAGRLAS